MTFCGYKIITIDGDTFVRDYEFLSNDYIYVIKGVYTDIPFGGWNSDKGKEILKKIKDENIQADHLLIIHTQPVEEVDFPYENIIKSIVPKSGWFRLDAVKLSETEILQKVQLVVESWVKNNG